MVSIDNTHQARIQAIRARQHFEDLLSVSSRHCERVRSRQRAENDSIACNIGEACDQHCRQANYERRLRSNVLTADERQDIKPSPAISIWFNTIGVTHQQRPPPPPPNGQEFLGAGPSGGCCARSPPVRNRYPGTQGIRYHITSKAMHAPCHEEPSRGLTAQIAVHKTTRNLTITNAPAVSKDVVMQPVDINLPGRPASCPQAACRTRFSTLFGPFGGPRSSSCGYGYRTLTGSLTDRSAHAPRPYCRHLDSPRALPTSLDTSGCFPAAIITLIFVFVEKEIFLLNFFFFEFLFIFVYFHSFDIYLKCLLCLSSLARASGQRDLSTCHVNLSPTNRNMGSIASSGSPGNDGNDAEASAYQPLTSTTTMHSETIAVEALFAESQRLEAFADFWRQRYELPKFVT